MDREHLIKYISMNYRYMNMVFSKELEQYGLNLSLMHYLLRLYHEDGISQETLKKWILKDKGTTARAIKKLEDLGYIYREKNEHDKREYRVFLTEKAIEIKPKIFEVIFWNRDVSEEGISHEEWEVALRVLQKMFDNYYNYYTKEYSEKED